VRSGGSLLWLASPFAHLSRDVDLEAAQLGGGEARGAVVGVHDPPMGWSAYGQTMTLPWLNADAVALAATREAAELAAAMAAAHLRAPSVRAAELLTRQACHLVTPPSPCRRAAHAGLQPAAHGVAAANTYRRLDGCSP
jgi:hypothetical protein